MRFFDYARRVAEGATYDGFKMGCVIAYRGHVIGAGANSDKTCPQQKYYNRRYRSFRRGTKPIRDSLHAEMSALRSVPWQVAHSIDWGKARVYVYRISPGKSSGHGMARPCQGCIHALRDIGVRKVLYTTDDGYCMECLD